MKPSPAHSKSVLITGCSSGIGAATATLLKEAGWRVFPTARKTEDLDALRDQGFEAIAMDLSDSASIDRAIEAVLTLSGGHLDGLVNNAGYCQAGAMEDVDRESLRQQFETNVFGVHQLTRALLPIFRNQGGGRIVNISSVLGRISTPMVGSYCASKYALEALSDAMRVELRGTGIQVSLVEPGAIVSRFRKNAAETLDQSVNRSASGFGDSYANEIDRRRKQVKQPDFFTRPPEEVARKVQHALDSRHPRRRYRVTPAAFLVELVVRFIPQAWTDPLLARRVPKRHTPFKEKA